MLGSVDLSHFSCYVVIVSKLYTVRKLRKCKLAISMRPLLEMQGGLLNYHRNMNIQSLHRKPSRPWDISFRAVIRRSDEGYAGLVYMVVSSPGHTTNVMFFGRREGSRPRTVNAVSIIANQQCRRCRISHEKYAVDVKVVVISNQPCIHNHLASAIMPVGRQRRRSQARLIYNWWPRRMSNKYQCIHCVQKNTHSHFLSYLHVWWVDINKN